MAKIQHGSAQSCFCSADEGTKTGPAHGAAWGGMGVGVSAVPALGTYVI